MGVKLVEMVLLPGAFREPILAPGYRRGIGVFPQRGYPGRAIPKQ